MRHAQELYTAQVDGLASGAEAKKARDRRYWELRRAGIDCKRWVLRDGHVVVGGGSYHCYILDIFGKDVFSLIKYKKAGK